MAVKGEGGEGPGGFEVIEPRALRLASQSADIESPQGGKQRLWLAAGAGAAGAAALLAVVWLLGDWGGGEAAARGGSASAPSAASAAPANTAPAGNVRAGSARAAGSSAPSSLPPYARERQAQQRAGARGRLGELVAAQDALSDMAVAQWGAAEFAAVQRTVEEADRLFSGGEYTAAESHYADALAAVQKLLGRAPAAARKAEQAGWQAFAARDAAQAQTQFQLTLAIAGGLQRAADARVVPRAAAAGAGGKAAAGLERARALPRVLELLRAGEAFAAQGELQKARQQFAEALKLDGANQEARSALAKVQQRIAGQSFRRAMSQGLQALNAGDFSAARGAFGRAAKLAPASTEPADGLRRVAAAELLARIRSLQQQAQTAEVQEQWPEAGTRWREVLALDSSLLRAREGAARARARAAIDSQLRALLADPWKLAEDAVHRDALALRQRALAAQPRGPRLSAQLEKLERVLPLARTPLPVRITSDGATEVRLHRVRDLGRFASLDLQLRPGRYTLQGTRRGYRDVLQPFELKPGGQLPVIDVRCAEKI